MEVLVKTTVMGLLFGTIGTTIGGIIGATIKTTSNRILSFILEFAAGLMTSVVCFELIPDAMELSNIVHIISGILFGIVTMILCDNYVKGRYSKKKSIHTNSLLKTGIIVGIGLAIHNFPEGLAIRFWF